MKSYLEVMEELTTAVQERSVHFYLFGMDEEIGRDEIGDELAYKITSALGNLSQMTEQGLPDKANHHAMEYLAEMMTLVRAQDEAMRKLTHLPVELRHTFIQYGHRLLNSIVMVSHLD